MWLIAGWVALILGIIGIALPVMPTVPFLILAAFCFEKGAPKLHRWLVAHPRLGPPIVDWQKHRVISLKAKIISLSCMSGSLGYLWLFREAPFFLKVLTTLIMTSVGVYILTRKSKREQNHV